VSPSRLLAPLPAGLKWVFALVALAHLWRTIAESSRLTTDPGFLLEGPGLGVVAAGFGVWAWSLLRVRPSTR